MDSAQFLHPVLEVITSRGISPIYIQCALTMIFGWLEVLPHWKAVWSCATRGSGEQSVMTHLVPPMLVLSADRLGSLRKVSRLTFLKQKLKFHRWGYISLATSLHYK